MRTSTLFASSLRRSAHIGGWLALSLALAGCSSMNSGMSKLSTLGGVLTPYKIDIVQGNVITSEQVAALREGMSREQVRDTLGTPLLKSVFHANRWDYVFTFKRQGQPEQKRRLTAFFKDNVLERFDADTMPSEVEFVASLEIAPASSKPPVLEATPEQLAAFHARNKPAAPASTSDTSTAAPASNYPPLEAP